MKSPFLYQVAEAYIREERENLPDYCFVFTNKRAATFFEHYLTLLAGDRPLIMPHSTTISEMVSGLSELTPVSRLDAIFVLYHKYKDLLPEAPGGDDGYDNSRLDFDRFLFWGEMLLSDFNDVDRYLVDPKKLFVNLLRVREVSTDFLTERQKEVLERYWGEKFQPSSPDQFWEHVNPRPDDPEAPASKFVKLWEVLLELYTSFQSTLRADGLGTEGMMIRDAVDLLEKLPADGHELHFRRYIFVGFNVITVSEYVIMNRLQKIGLADFYWDFASPAFASADNVAARFMRRNIRNFPSRYEIEASRSLPSEAFPEITVTGVPSAVGQAKIAGSTLRKWQEENFTGDSENSIDTAVVLPDESLLMPMIHAVPRSFGTPNVTMGFPLRSTPFASFMDALLKFHSEGMESAGEWQYYYRDVTVLLTHPLLNRLDHDGCSKMLSAIVGQRLYMVPASLLQAELPELAWLFTPMRLNQDRLADELYDFLHSILLTLNDRLEASIPEKETVGVDGEIDEEIDDADGRQVAETIDIFYARGWLSALEELKSAIDRRGIRMGEDTFITMLRRAVGSTTINFAGEPLKGLQVMGVLETRSLDFDNIIILSMNEKVFPRKVFTRSFIPDTLRRAYGMATTDHQESIFAYYFYRLISRASRVTILYDIRDSGIGSSEVSRYVAQLLYLFPECKVTHNVATFPSLLPASGDISVEKTPAIMEKINSYTTPGGSNLSVSAIKTYLKCPLSFYLKYIGKVYLESDEMDFMDAPTFGNVFHQVVEKLYKGAAPGGGTAIITADLIKSWISGDAAISTHIEPLVTRAVNKHFNRLGEDSDRPLTGEALAMGRVVRRLVVDMLKQELSLTPFEFVAGEYPLKGTLRLGDRNINVFQIIDRIDRVRMADGKMGLRFVDYKTGSDETSAPEVETWFDGPKPPGALIQLMFYCCAYAANTGYEESIQPIIYKVSEIGKNGIKPCLVARTPLDDYRPYREAFIEGLTAALDPLFDPDVPFAQTEDADSCKYCTFRAICRR